MGPKRSAAVAEVSARTTGAVFSWHERTSVMASTHLCAALLVVAAAAPSAVAEVKQVRLERLAASADAGPKYGIEKACDGVTDTHWAGANRPPVWVRAELAQAEWISRIRIRQSAATAIYDNWRRIAVTFSDASSFSCVLGDQWQEQVVAFPRRQVYAVKITIESTYKTSHYVGLSELILEDEGPAVQARVGVSVDPPAKPPVAESQPLAPGAARPTGQDGSADSAALLQRLSPIGFVSSGHPTLFVGPDDVQRAAANIRNHAWARRVFAGILAGADGWLDLSDDQLRAAMPRREALFDNKAPCPECGGACSAGLQQPHAVVCRKCQVTYPNAQHPDDGRGWKNPQTGEVTYFVGLYNSFAVDRITDGVQDLADAYVLTGDRRYARVLSVLLDGLAAIYPGCDKGPVWYPGVGGRLNRPFYQTARTLIYYANVYDLTYDSPEWDRPSNDPAAGTRRVNFEQNLLRNGAEYCFGEVTSQKSPGLHNGNCDYLQGALAVGRVLGIAQYIDFVLDSDLSIFNFIDNTIDRDGQYYETSFAYSRHAVELFGHHAEMLRNFRSPRCPQGVNLYDLPKLRANYLRAERDIDCAGHQPALGDAGPDLAVAGEDDRLALLSRIAERLEVLAARTTDPVQRRDVQRQLWQLAEGDIDAFRAKSLRGRWLLFHARDLSAVASHEDPLAPPERDTLLAGGRGVAILRSGSAGSGQRCALLRYGATLNHGSADEMNVNLYAFGREISYDQGYGWAHHRCGWAHSTVAHNVVVVNQKNQLRQAAGSGGSLEQFCQSPRVRVAAADAPLAYSAEGVRRYRRLLALVDTGRDASYVLDTFDVAGGEQHELSQHFFGSLARTDGATFGSPQTSGSLAGPQYEWWNRIEPSGWLRGEKQGFYWNAPPENGYGFLFHVRQSLDPRAGGPDGSVRTEACERAACRFVWRVGERLSSAPRGVTAPAECGLAASNCRVQSLGFGGVRVSASRPGDFATLPAPVETAGEYVVLARFTKSAQGGMVVSKIDGQPLGEPVNTYSPVAYASDWVALGRVRLTAGGHELRLESAGKDAESGGHEFVVRAFALESPDRLESRPEKQMEGVALHSLPAADSQFLLAKAKGLTRAPTSDYLIIRRRGKDLVSRFVSVIEPFVGAEPALTATVCGPAACQAVTKVASADGRADYFVDLSDGKPGEVAFQDGGVPIRFAGQFAAVLTRSGKPVEILLSGPQALQFGDVEATVEQAGYRAKVVAVDYDKSLVTVDSALPPGAIAGPVNLASFSRSGYSRNAPYTVRHIAPVAAGCQLDLGGVSLVLGKGRAVASVSVAGLVANGVPLDREKAYGRSVRTGYFDGKAIRNLRTGQLGRIKNVNLDSSVLLDVNPDLRPGDRFELLDLQAGDAVEIPGVVALWQTAPNHWTVRSNVPLSINLPDAASLVVDPTSGGQGVVARETARSGKRWRFTVAGNACGE